MNPQAAAQPIHTEPTPNPNTLKFNVHQTLLASGSADFPTKESAQRSPLAAKLFGIAGVTGVFLGRDFVTITKSGAGDWQGLVASVTQTIQQHLAAGEPITAQADAGAAAAGGGSDLERKIREIIDREVRPAVAMDGGDIIFIGFQSGIVKLHLQGSCHGCPSSLMTLKMGIEQRLRRTVPEVVAVEAV
jgi:Fe-S cluster biogenesis protein NfuA